MDWLHVVILAIIQGFTEFLPISSSGHLVLPAQVLGWPDQGLAFDVAVHVGSLAAVVLYFRRDVASLLLAWGNSFTGRHNSDSRLAWLVILGTIPAGIIGLLANDWIEANLRGIEVIAATTIIFGLLLGFADRVGKRSLSMTEIWKRRFGNEIIRQMSRAARTTRLKSQDRQCTPRRRRAYGPSVPVHPRTHPQFATESGSDEEGNVNQCIAARRMSDCDCRRWTT